MALSPVSSLSAEHHRAVRLARECLISEDLDPQVDLKQVQADMEALALNMRNAPFAKGLSQDHLLFLACVRITLGERACNEIIAGLLDTEQGIVDTEHLDYLVHTIGAPEAMAA